MKLRLPIITAALLGFPAAGPAASAQDQPAESPPAPRVPIALLLPEQRVVVTVAPEERNPFGQLVRPRQPTVFETGDTEETRLRGLLGMLPVGGITEDRQGVTALFGGIRLREGDNLPNLVPSQVERIRVVAIDRNRITFGFVEKDGVVGDRTLTRSISMAPEVRYLLPSQGQSVPAAGQGGFGGVYRGNGTR